jgi:hypothetical protein
MLGNRGFLLLRTLDPRDVSILLRGKGKESFRCLRSIENRSLEIAERINPAEMGHGMLRPA